MDTTEGKTVEASEELEFIPQLELEDPSVLEGVALKGEEPKEVETEQEEEEEERDEEGFVLRKKEDFNDDDEEEEEVEEEGEEDKPSYAKNADEIAIGTYKTLIEKNFIEEDAEFDGTWDSLDKIVSSLPTRVAHALIAQAPPVTQSLIQYALSGGEGMTLDKLEGFFNAVKDTTDSADVDISTIDGARKYIRQQMIAQGEDPEDAEDYIDVLEDKGEGKLFSKAKTLLEKEQNVKHSKAQQLMQQEAAEKAQREEYQKRFMQSIEEELSQTGYRNDRMNKIRNEILTGSMNKKAHMANSSPKALTQLADFFTYFDEAKGVFDLTSYKKHIAGKEVENIKNNIARNFSRSEGTSRGSSTRKGKGSGLEGLEIIL